MNLPKYHELYVPFLSVISDECLHPLKEVKQAIAECLQLEDTDLALRLPSNRQTVFDNRVGWAKTYLKKAGMIETPKRAYVQITQQGKNALLQQVPLTDEFLALHSEEFARFKKGIKAPDSTENQSACSERETSAETPMETFEHVYQTINEQLADDLFTEIMAQSPSFFENLVVDLMRAMGYGDGFVTKNSGDGGIDGIIHEDKLGFNLIYIQAKRWNPETVIGRPEVQKFAGAMMGPPKIEKGLFIATCRFSQAAKKFADAQHIILVDGQKLAQLMIEHEVGVSTQKTYQIKRIDSDYFLDDASF